MSVPLVVGTIKEIKDNENRVGLIPYGVKHLTEQSTKVIVEKGAGLNSGFTDAEYIEAGAEMMDKPEDIVKNCDILVKVKEPLESEYHLLDIFAGKVLYTYLHLSGVPRSLTEKILERRITAIAYETIEDEKGGLPCLAPMSEVAGVLAIQYGAEYLQKKYHGIGITLGTVTGTPSAHTVVVGGGICGTKAAATAAGMGGKVSIFEINPARVAQLKEHLADLLGPNLYRNVNVVESTPETFNAALKDADLIVGAVLIPGKKAPTVISEEQVKSMKTGAVIVDVSIDQGGCIWGSHATTHSKPIYELHNKIYCCVANMPGQAARQSTQALTSATLPYLKEMCKHGVFEALLADKGLCKGLNALCGRITYKAVAEDWELMDKYLDLSAVQEASASELQSCQIG